MFGTGASAVLVGAQPPSGAVAAGSTLTFFVIPPDSGAATTLTVSGGAAGCTWDAYVICGNDVRFAGQMAN